MHRRPSGSRSVTCWLDRCKGQTKQLHGRRSLASAQLSALPLLCLLILFMHVLANHHCLYLWYISMY
jgi:hypothetical protein